VSLDTATPERLIPVPGTYNLRDVGGYRAGTSVTRWGRLLRSDALHSLDEIGQTEIARIGIDHVIDLRSDDERVAAPSRLAASTVVHHLPVFSGAAPSAVQSPGITLAALYDHIIDHRADRLAASIGVISETRTDETVLVHCTAGKDRTGLVIALVLSAVGVDRDEVVADYAATEANLAGEWVERMLASLAERTDIAVDPAAGQIADTPGVIELVSASPAQVMSDLLDRVDREHGSAADYLIRNGLPADRIDRLTSSLVI